MSISQRSETAAQVNLSSDNASAPASAAARAPQGQALAKGKVDFDASAALVLRERARSWRERVPLVVDSDLMLSVAAEDLRTVKALAQEVESQRVAITRPLNEALRAVNALFRAPKQFLQEAEELLKQAMLAYTAAERQRLDAERSHAEQRQSEQRARLASEQRALEASARLAEAAAQAAQARAERAAAAGDEQAAANEQASAAQHRQHADRRWAQARVLAQQAQQDQVVTYAAELAAAPRVEGISERTTYTAQVTNLRQLVCAAAAGQAPLECLQADDKFLAAQARAVRRAGELYPGVRVELQRSLAACLAVTAEAPD